MRIQYQFAPMTCFSVCLVFVALAPRLCILHSLASRLILHDSSYVLLAFFGSCFVEQFLLRSEYDVFILICFCFACDFSLFRFSSGYRLFACN